MSIEQMVRDLLSQALEDELFENDVDPQEFSSGDVCGCANLLSTFLGDGVKGLKAVDVMMRRGWGVVREADGWTIDLRTAACGSQRLRDEGWRGWFAGPFDALIEADAWYIENVERKAGQS